MKKAVKYTAVALGCVLAMVLVYTGFSFAHNAEKAFSGQQATGQALQAQADGFDGGGSMLRWGVLLFAVGEFAGLIGMGISHIRSQKRQEASMAQMQVKPGPGARQADMLRYGQPQHRDGAHRRQDQ